MVDVQAVEEATPEAGPGAGPPADAGGLGALVDALPWPSGRRPDRLTRRRLVEAVQLCSGRGHPLLDVREVAAAGIPGATTPAGSVLQRLRELADAEPEPVTRTGTASSRPPWCGECTEPTRQRELPDGRPYRCPMCHPLTYKPHGQPHLDNLPDGTARDLVLERAGVKGSDR